MRYYCGNVILTYHILAHFGVLCFMCYLVDITCMSQGIINLSPRGYCCVSVLFSVSVHLLTNLILFTDYEVTIVIIRSKINVLIRQLITPFCYMVTLCFFCRSCLWKAEVTLCRGHRLHHHIFRRVGRFHLVSRNLWQSRLLWTTIGRCTESFQPCSK